ncbi:MAG: hypothetical protein HC839_03080 [Leptolyngbyaceae cyanobacterium RM2_2_21]|nr:hypothetical protein [Leptolyngbyaceae cyanobacterium RM2_2_21]
MTNITSVPSHGQLSEPIVWQCEASGSYQYWQSAASVAENVCGSSASRSQKGVGKQLLDSVYEKNSFQPVDVLNLPPAFLRMKGDTLFYRLVLQPS